MTNAQPSSPRPAEPRSGFFLHVMPAALYVVAVFIGGALRHGPPLPPTGPLPQDKVFHFLAFGMMLFIVLRALRFVFEELPLVRQIVIGVAVVSALGALLELVQAALPYRDAEVLDWVADTLGALAAAAIAWRVLRLPAPGK